MITLGGHFYPAASFPKAIQPSYMLPSSYNHSLITFPLYEKIKHLPVCLNWRFDCFKASEGFFLCSSVFAHNLVISYKKYS